MADLKIPKLLEEMYLLKQQVKALEDRVIVLEEKVIRASNTSHSLFDTLLEYDQMLKDSTDEAHNGIRGAFDRIKNLETKVFPNLMSDLQQLHNIIGNADGTAERSEERKKP